MRDWAEDRYTLAYVLRCHWRGVTFAVFVLLLIPFIAWSAATLENPSPGAIKSGVSLISGWICDAAELEVSFDGGPRVFVPYGSDREDTRGVCGDVDNGFGLLFNYNELGDGPHTITLYADGRATTQVNFSVQTLGTNFLRGVSGQGTIPLSNGATVTVRWEETTQGFAIIGYEEDGGGGNGTGRSRGDLSELRPLLGEWGLEITRNGKVADTNIVLTDIQTTPHGTPMLVGEILWTDGKWLPVEGGYAADFLPDSISATHGYVLQTVLFPEDGVLDESLFSSFDGICDFITFEAADLVPDFYEELEFPIVSHLTAYEDGACTDHYFLGPPLPGEVYLYQY